MWIQTDETTLINTDSGCMVYYVLKQSGYQHMDFNYYFFLYFTTTYGKDIPLLSFTTYDDKDAEANAEKQIIDKFNELKTKLGVIND